MRLFRKDTINMSTNQTVSRSRVRGHRRLGDKSLNKYCSEKSQSFNLCWWEILHRRAVSKVYAVLMRQLSNVPPEGETASSQQTIRSRDKISWRIYDQKQEVVWHSERSEMGGGVYTAPGSSWEGSCSFSESQNRAGTWTHSGASDRNLASVLLQEKLPAVPCWHLSASTHKPLCLGSFPAVGSDYICSRNKLTRSRFFKTSD